MFRLQVVESELEQVLQRAAEQAARRVLEERAESAGWLDAAAAADHLSLSEEAIRGLVKRREIPFVKLPNGRIRFERTALDAWARSRGEAA